MIGEKHEIHTRRFGRNLGLGLVLGTFVALVFGLTVVKVTNGMQMSDFKLNDAPSAITAPAVAPAEPVN